MKIIRSYDPIVFYYIVITSLYMYTLFYIL